ncbi:hypothetical protein K3495_g286 [Podosphaera aphanis]|nr:hypothetical protein K3495_g286 [Podosphaera aphanis]
MKLSRTMSRSQRPNRLSLSFPVASRKSSIDLIRHGRSPTITSPPPSLQAEIKPSPADPSAFLVVLAGQERHVLELKEELHKAENKLKELKRQWARYEEDKKKGESINMEPLQQVNGLGLESSDIQALEAMNRRSVEENRRKALFENINLPKETRRTFSGAHTRTLSLLSRDRSTNDEYSSIIIPNDTYGSENSLRRRSTMSPDSMPLSKSVSSGRARHSHHSNGVLTGAKQLAGLAEGVTEGFKTGMWTFLEDLRQATVGDEGVNGKVNHNSSSVEPTNKSFRRSRQSNVFEIEKRSNAQKVPSPRTWETLTGTPPPSYIWNETGSRLTNETPSKVKKHKPLPLTASILDNPEDPDDSWSAWDDSIPKSPRWSDSSANSSPLTPPDSGSFDGNIKITDQSPKNITSISPRSDKGAWPALDKFSPVNLKENLQTAMGTILKELEKGSKFITEERNDPTTRSQMKSRLSPKILEQSTEEELILMSR